MRLSRALRFVTCLMIASMSLQAGEAKRKVLMAGCGLGQIILLDQDNKLLWETNEKREVTDIWLLEDGSIVHSTKDGYQMIKPDYKTGKGAEVVWSNKAPKGYECHTCQPIGEDRYLVGMSSNSRCYLAEVDSKGKEHKVIEVPARKSKHGSFRQVRKTPDGTYLTSQQCKKGKALEYSADGKLLRTFPVGRYAGKRLANGNTLLTDEHRLVEVDKDNKIVWELNQKDLPDLKLGYIGGFWVLKNGNVLLTNWGGHGGSSGGAVLEVTRDKKLVYSSGKAVKNRVLSVFVVETTGE